MRHSGINHDVMDVCSVRARARAHRSWDNYAEREDQSARGTLAGVVKPLSLVAIVLVHVTCISMLNYVNRDDNGILLAISM